MVKRALFVLILAIGLGGSARSQAIDSSWEVYAQASSTDTDLIFGNSAAGVHVGTTWKPTPSLGLVADVGLESGSGANGAFSYTTFAAGPRVYSAERRRLSGFMQALGGVSRASAIVHSRKRSDWNYVVSGGAGFDIRLTDHIALRPLELDLLIAGGKQSPVVAARVSAGLVFRFGQRR